MIGQIITAFFSYKALVYPTLLGLGFILVGCLINYDAYSTMRDGIKTEAQTVRYESREEKVKEGGQLERTRIMHSIVVRFTDQNGRVWEVKDSYSSSRKGYVLGDTVTIFYNPERPRKFTIDNGFFYNYIFGFIFILVGFGALIPLIMHIYSIIKYKLKNDVINHY